MYIKKSFSFGKRDEKINIQEKDSMQFPMLPKNLPRIFLVLLADFGFVFIPVIAANLTPLGALLRQFINAHLGIFAFCLIVYSICFLIVITKTGEWSAIYHRKSFQSIDVEALKNNIENLKNNLPIEIEHIGSDKIKIKWNYANEKFKYSQPATGV